MIYIKGPLAGAIIALAASAHAAVPVANDDNRTVTVDTPITINVLNNDFDADGDPITIASVGEAANGTVTLLDGGAIQYTPNAGFSGTDSFTYTITDNVSETPSSPATVTILVTDSVLGFGSRGNDLSVAQTLEAACNELVQTVPEQLGAGALQLRERCFALQDMIASDSPELATALNRIAPEETIAMMQLGATSASMQSSAVQQRMSNPGSPALTINGVGMSRQIAGGAAGDSDYAFARSGFFSTLQLERGDKRKTEWENGFDYTANSLTVGYDYRVDSRIVIGAALGVTRNDLDYKFGDGSVNTDTTTVIAFGSYTKDSWSNDFQLGYNTSEFEMRRNIRYQSALENFQATARGDTAGKQFFLSAQSQYFWSRDALSLFPQFKLDILQGSIDGYAENNAGGFEVMLGNQKMSQITMHLGMMAQYATPFNWGVLVPQLELRASSEVLSDQDAVEGAFAFSPIENQVFVMEAEDGDKNYYNVALGTSFIIPNGISGFVRYDRMLGYRHFSSNRIEAGVRLEF